MNEQEIREQLALMEMKIQSILRDIRHVRGILDHAREDVVTNHNNFFNALRAEDEHEPSTRNTNNNGQ